MKRIFHPPATRYNFRVARITAAVIALGAASTAANAGTGDPFKTGSSLTKASNYTSGNVPTNVTDVSLTTTTTGLTISAGAATMESLTNTTSTAYTITNAGASGTNSTLTLGNGSGFTNYYDSVTNDLIALTSTGNLTITGNSGTATLGIVLASSGNFDLTSTSTLAISAVISDGGSGFGITETGGSGTLALSGANTFGGGLTLSAGTLDINNGGNASASALGTGTFKISGGTISNTSGADLTVATNNAQTWAGNFAFVGSGGTNNLNLGTGAVTLTANAQVNISGSTSNLTVGGPIGDSNKGYGLTVTGTGKGSTLILTGANTYSGGTTVTAGVLEIAGTSSLPTTGSVYVGTSTGTPSAELLLYNPTSSTTVAPTYGSALQSLTLNGSGITGGNSGALRVDAATGAVLNATWQGTTTLASAAKITVTTGNSLNLTGNVSDGGYQLQKQGGGTLTLNGTGNILTGTALVGNGTLKLANASGAAVSGAYGLTVAATGTLLMGANNQLNALVGVTLTGATGSSNAAIIGVGGFNQGGTMSSGVGALTLTSGSVNNAINFGNTPGVISFASLTTNSATLTISNYVNNNGTSGGADELIFNQDEMNSLGNIVFTGYGASSETNLGNGFFEVFPVVPEPATVFGGLLLVGALGWNQRYRLRGLARAMAGARSDTV